MSRTQSKLLANMSKEIRREQVSASWRKYILSDDEKTQTRYVLKTNAETPNKIVNFVIIKLTCGSLFLAVMQRSLEAFNGLKQKLAENNLLHFLMEYTKSSAETQYSQMIFIMTAEMGVHDKITKALNELEPKMSEIMPDFCTVFGINLEQEYLLPKWILYDYATNLQRVRKYFNGASKGDIKYFLLEFGLSFDLKIFMLTSSAAVRDSLSFDAVEETTQGLFGKIIFSFSQDATAALQKLHSFGGRLRLIEEQGSEIRQFINDFIHCVGNTLINRHPGAFMTVLVRRYPEFFQPAVVSALIPSQPGDRKNAQALEEIGFLSNEIPDRMLCFFSKEIMDNPLVDLTTIGVDGNLAEAKRIDESSFIRAVVDGNFVSPLTRRPMTRELYQPDLFLKAEIDEFVARALLEADEKKMRLRFN